MSVKQNDIVKHLKSCCVETSLHGPKYLIKNNGSALIFLFWFCICLTALVFCIIMLWLQWDVYKRSPTLTSIENTNKPIYETRFPAVSVCNNNQVYLPATADITGKLLQAGFENETIYEFYSYLSFLNTFDLVPGNFTEITEAITDLGYDMASLMFELSQPCEILIERCHWFYGDCKSRIKKIKTENGYCCSLNYHLPQIYSNDAPTNDSEERLLFVGSAGKMVELHFVLNVQPATYVSSTQPFYGVEILIHDGFAFPEVSIVPIIAEINTEVNTLIGVHTIETDPQVAAIPIQQRKCLFDGEEVIKSSFEYSFETCVSECRVLRMIALCQCVPYYYRHEGGERFCNFSDIACLNRYQTIFYGTYNPNFDKDQADQIDKVGLNLEECLCYPECDDTIYDVQAQSFRFGKNATYFLSALSKIKSIDLRDKIILSAAYRHLTFIQYRRDVGMTWNNLLASLGGIFGLCVGGSVISIAEFVYLFFLYFFKKNQSTVKLVAKNPTKVAYQFKIYPRHRFGVNYFE